MVAAAEVPPLPPPAAAAANAGSDESAGGGAGSGGGDRVPLARKPRNREVSSRYKAAAAAVVPAGRRCPSPNLGRSVSTASDSSSAASEPAFLPKRAHSAERKRDAEQREPWQSVLSAPATPAASDHALRPNGMHVSRARRGSTPERKRLSTSAAGVGGWRQDHQAENARPFENQPARQSELFHKWPGTKPVVVSRSVDLSSDQQKVAPAGVGSARPPSRQLGPRTDMKCVRRLLDEADLGRCDSKPNSISESELTVPATTEGSQQSGTTTVPEQQAESEQQQPRPSNKPMRTARGTEVPARFWQDLGSRIRRLSDVNQLRSSMPEGDAPGTVVRPGRRTRPASFNSVVTSGSTTTTTTTTIAPAAWSFSPGAGRATQQPSSPSGSGKSSSPSRTLPSPTRGKAAAYPTPFNGVFQGGVRSSGGVACMLNFGGDTTKGRKAALSQQEEAHYLRILHNRWLQWRLVNARAQTAMESQRATAERVLYNACSQITDLQSRVREKRIEYQQARQQDKVFSMLSSHGKHLDDWGELEDEHSTSLTGTIRALEAGSLRVPITGGAKIDVQALKQAICSASDVIASLDSSVGAFESGAEKTNEMVFELAQVAAQEKAVLEECGELLDTIAALETEERSLRSYFVQLESEKKRLTTTTSDSGL